MTSCGPTGPENWQRVWRTFHAALDLDEAARAGFVTQRLPDDPGAQREVLGLLRAHAAPSLLDRTALPLLNEDLAGSRIGDWQLQRRLGEGGMGSVHLAARSDGNYEQLAAIKLMDPALSAEGDFQSERRALALLRHPHIAQFYDSGISASGARYLVLEYVDGERIDAWCRTRKLELAERLQLLVSVCRAVHFAHRNLVVHLDLKPSNVLVTREGVPKLIDFGIAAPPGGDAGGGMERMTPDYASPEQLRGEPATTASDVFALGLLLYELCSGQRPFEAWSADGGSEARMVAMCQGPPALTGETRLEPERIGRWRLAELDAILAKALAVRVEDRYGSAEALADDIERWLARRPLMVRGTGLGYRLRLAASRSPLVFGASVFVILAAAGMVTALALQEQNLQRALLQAETQAERAQAAASFLRDVFLRADPEQPGGAPLSAVDVLTQGAARLEQVPDAALRAELGTVLGRAFLNLSKFDLAEQSFLSALVILQDGARAPALRGLAALRQEQARFAEAESLQREALALIAAGSDESEARLELAGILQSQGRLDEAAAQLERLHPDADTPELIGAVALKRGNIALGRGRHVEAEQHYRQALDSLSKAPAPAPHDVARARYALGIALHRLGRYDEADQHYAQSWTMRQQIYGEAHARSVEAVHARAALAYDAGDAAAAVTLGEQVLDALGKLHGADSPRLASAHNNLGLALHELGRFDEAESHYRQALAHHRATRGEQHAHVASSLANLALLALDRDRPEAARQDLLTAQAIVRDSLPVAHPIALGIEVLLGRAALRQGDLSAARRHLESARTQREALGEGGELELASTLYWLAWTAAAQDDPEQALAAAEHALQLRSARLRPGDWRTVQSRIQLLALRRQSGEANAEAELQTQLQALRELRGEDDWRTQRLRQRLLLPAGDA
jgi:serine/threonine-protein kinase